MNQHIKSLRMKYRKALSDDQVLKELVRYLEREFQLAGYGTLYAAASCSYIAESAAFSIWSDIKQGDSIEDAVLRELGTRGGFSTPQANQSDSLNRIVDGVYALLTRHAQEGIPLEEGDS